MIDFVLAERLHLNARHGLTLAFDANRLHHGERTAIAVGLIAQSVHLALLSFIVSIVTVEDPFDETPRSLVDLARSVEAAGVHDFKSYEAEVIAELDTIHLRAVTRVLLPDHVTERTFSGAHTFVDRLIQSLDEHLRTMKEKAT